MNTALATPHTNLRAVIENYEPAKAALRSNGIQFNIITISGKTERVTGLSVECDGILLNKKEAELKAILKPMGYRVFQGNNETIYIK